MLYRARTIFPLTSSPIQDGGIVIDQGYITALGKYRELDRATPHHIIRKDLGEVILLPGLINLHTHLEYSQMPRHWQPEPNSQEPERSFTDWVPELLQAKQSWSEQDLLEAYQVGIEELQCNGTTTIVNTASFGSILPQLTPRLGQFWELIEIMNPRGQTQLLQSLEEYELLLEKSSRGWFYPGITPHAPQTTSLSCYQIAQQKALADQVLFSTHLLESEEEIAMFLKREGKMFEFFSQLGRDMGDCHGQSPLYFLLKESLLPPGALLVHMNYLTPSDKELLSGYHHQFGIIHAPQTHAYFRRPPWDYTYWKEHGFLVALGTDSIASNNQLNLFAEMQMMRSTAPEIPPEQILRMATLYPGLILKRAIQRGPILGQLCIGALADFITLPYQEKVPFNTTTVSSENALAEYVIYAEEKPDLFFSVQNG